ncbi:MAG: glycosyltransferase family 4 protein [Paludibacterium sp.]|uniref:glycosyltransferase family 4 protein n=1 Tax=Paludibacterium sp. TaxID=1917523 RepID=UPI0025FC8E14|nr:glycosyltransferase family 4 protein [Paludibacterium sp.]MBV8046666.1 glycosyltransferase family 4 protein [Paludibacterium sp.]MBV8647901.1 glycosyltransferase family 4 protein [Paludibacterium sp.]
MARHVVFTESSPNVGGQELQLMQQMRLLGEAGVDCTLACRPGGRVEALAKRQGLETFPVAFRNSLHPPSIMRLRGLLARTRARLLICHSGHDSNNAAVAARLVAQRPFILRSRTYLTGSQKAFSYNRLFDATMVPSQFIKDELLRDPAVQAARIHVVYPGIDFDLIDAQAEAAMPESVAAWLAAADGPVLLHAAMLRGEKGHQTLLSALAQLRTKYPTLRYLMAGEGIARPEIEATIRALGLASSVLMAGNVMPVHGLYRHATLVVMPSLFEPLGMSQIEALALAVPVVASRTGGIPETVTDGETGVLVEPGDVNAWVRALDQALSDPSRMQRMAQAGSEDVRRRFSVARNTAQLLAFLPNA